MDWVQASVAGQWSSLYNLNLGTLAGHLVRNKLGDPGCKQIKKMQMENLSQLLLGSCGLRQETTGSGERVAVT
jgi:hypothetical protein